MTRRDEDWALFWATLLAPIRFGDVPEDQVTEFLRELAAQERRLPNDTYKKISESTLRRKLEILRTGGTQALVRKRRSDRGQPRAWTKAMVDRAIALKRDQPKRSHRTINNVLDAEFKAKIPPATLYRHLKQAGATRLKLGVEKKKIRCRWTRDHTHALWVGDFEHGPYVMHEGTAVATRLAVWIDCHSRYIVEARYYYSESFDILIDSLLRAWGSHGCPEGLYVDNAKVYHARALALACAALDIRRSFRPVGDPPPGGIIERFIQTVQNDFEAEVRAGGILTLEELNRRFSAWLEMVYHRSVHREIKQAPRDRYQEGLRAIRHVDLDAAAKYFMRREKRVVHRDYSDVQVDNRFYRVDPSLRGDSVEVRYDPYGTRQTVLLYSLDEVYLGAGELHNRERRADIPTPPPRPKPSFDYLSFLVQQHEQELEAQARGIDYRQVVVPRRWPFTAFVSALASLLGRQGGVSAFSTDEIEALQKCYNTTPRLSRPLLEEAVAAASEKTVLAVLFQLRQSKRKE
jgi:transposase InsO family protein